MLTRIFRHGRNERRLGGRRRADACGDHAEIAAAGRLAEILIVGFGKCELAGRPLSELQQIDLLATALTVFDGYRDEVEGHVRIEETLRELARLEAQDEVVPSGPSKLSVDILERLGQASRNGSGAIDPVGRRD